MREDSRCFNCENNLRNPLMPYSYGLKDNTFKAFFPDLHIYFCSSCGIGQVDHKTFEHEKLENYYKRVYRSKAQFNEASAGEEYKKAYFRARAKGQAILVNKYIKNDVKNILDFGGGYGDILQVFGKAFPRAKLYINELDETIDLPSNCYRDDIKSKIKYDVIIMSHVLEHLCFPQMLIRDLLQRLNRDGLLIIEVPNQKSDIISLEVDILEPHITFFSLESLREFFERHFNQQLEILQLSTAGRLQTTLQKQSSDKRASAQGSVSSRKSFKEIIKQNAFPLFQLLKWVFNKNPLRKKYSFNFSNDSEKDIYNDIRIVLRKT